MSHTTTVGAGRPYRRSRVTGILDIVPSHPNLESFLNGSPSRTRGRTLPDTDWSQISVSTTLIIYSVSLWVAWSFYLP